MLTAPALSDQLGNSLATDYFFLREQLTESQIELLVRVRNFVDDEVLPVIGGYWERAEMPWPLLQRLGELGIVGDDIQGYGCPGLDPIAAGLVNMELSRGDGSLATFLGVQSGLAMKSIAMLGSEEQKQRWLPEMARLREARGVRADRARPRLRFGRTRDDRDPRRRLVRAQRRQAVDRKRQPGRRRRGLGTRGGRPGPRVPGREGIGRLPGGGD